MVDLHRGRLPTRTRRRVAMARVRVRKASAPLRRLPEVIVVGAQRSGTSSLFRFLAAHPDVRRPVRKEIEYFASEHGRGQAWYRAHFPIRSASRRSMDCTPQYLLHPHAPARAHAVVPDARIVVLLRDPVERAVSHWRHLSSLGLEALGFDDAVAAEVERTDALWERMLREPGFEPVNLMRFSYLRRGRYAEQLDRWRAWFPPDQIGVYEMERMVAEPGAVLGDIERFLGLRETDPTTFANASTPHVVSGDVLDAASRAALRAHFAESDEALRRSGFTASWL